MNKLILYRFVSVAANLSIITCAGVAHAQAIEPTLPGGKIRTYYIAAVETEWNYAPAGVDRMTGRPLQVERQGKLHYVAFDME